MRTEPPVHLAGAAMLTIAADGEAISALCNPPSNYVPAGNTQHCGADLTSPTAPTDGANQRNGKPKGIGALEQGHAA